MAGLLNHIFRVVVLFTLLIIPECFASTILASVGKEVVTSNDLEKRYEAFIKTNNATPNANEEKAIKLEILNSLVNEKIINQEAKRLNIHVEDAEIMRTIAHIEQMQNMESGSLLKRNEELGIPAEEFKTQMHNKLILEKILFEVIFPYTNTVVYDSEIQEVLSMEHPELIRVKAFLLKDINARGLKNLHQLNHRALCDVSIIAKASSISPVIINSLLSDIRDSRIKQIASSAKNESMRIVYRSNEKTTALIICEKKSIASQHLTDQIKEKIKSKKLDNYAQHYLTTLRKKRSVEIHVTENL